MGSGELRGSPRIYLDKGEVTVKTLVRELGERGLAELSYETPLRSDVKLCAKLHTLKTGQARCYIKIVDLKSKSKEEQISYKCELSRLALTLEELMHMNQEVVPPKEILNYLPLSQLKMIAMSADVSNSAQVTDAILAAATSKGGGDEDDDGENDEILASAVAASAKEVTEKEKEVPEKEMTDLELAAEGGLSQADLAMMPTEPPPKGLQTPPKGAHQNKRIRDSPGQAGPKPLSLSGRGEGGEAL